MDNMIAGAVAVIIFGAFTIGLAASIDAWPFSMIVGIVLLALVYDYIQSLRHGDDPNNHRK